MSNSRGNVVVTLLIVVLALGALGVALLAALASSKARQARTGWDRTLGSFDEVMARYPATEANATALELERLSARLGIDLAPRQFRERAPADEQARAEFEGIRDLLARHSQRQMERPQRGPIEPFPADGAEYLRRRSGELDDLRAALLRGDIAEWESDLSRLQAAPIPNLLGQINLYKLLAADALFKLAAGEREGALADVEASWKLGRSLRDTPILINQLIAIAGARMQAATLRQIPDVPAGWLDRLAPQDYREGFLTAMKYEGWVWAWSDSLVDDEPSVFARVLRPVIASYTRLCLADTSETYRRRIVNLSGVDALCDHDLSLDNADLDIPIPRWNRIGEVIVPNLAHAIDRLARLELDLELTRKSIELDAARRANGGAWPADVAGIERSTACPNDRWIYDAGTDGSMSLALSRDVSWPGQIGIVLPNRIEARR